MKQIFLLMLSALILVFSCADLDRDNLLDPQNPNSYTDRAVLVELFINDSTGYEYCEHAIETIEEIGLREENDGKLFVLEYHLTNAGWNDKFASSENNQRYHEYIPASSQRGIPDAFFNGLGLRVQGASEVNIYHRYSAAVEQLIGDKGYFLFEAEKEIVDNFLNLDVTIARLGNSEKKNLTVNAVVFEDLGRQGQRYVVRKVLPRQTISSFDSGQVKNYRFSASLSNVESIDQTYVLVFLQDQNKTTRDIYQVAKF